MKVDVIEEAILIDLVEVSSLSVEMEVV